MNRRNQNLYSRQLLTKIVGYVKAPEDTSTKDFFMFWPITTGWGYPNRRRDLLVSERFAIAGILEKLAGGEKRIKAASLQIECLIDWHSFLSLPGLGLPETVNFYKNQYPNIITTFSPNYIKEPYSEILPLIEKLWESIHTNGQNDYWLFDPRLSKVFGQIDLEKRKEIFGKFLLYLEREQANYLRQQNRGPYWMPWPVDIAQIVKSTREKV